MNPTEITVAELPGGRVYLAGRNNVHSDGAEKCTNGGHDNRVYALLEPGATGFYRGFEVEADMVTPQANSGVLTFGNQLLFAGPATLCDQRHNLQVRASADRGCSWGPGTTLWSGDNGYTDLVRTSAGRVLVLAEAGDTEAHSTISRFVYTPPAATSGLLSPDVGGSHNDACLKDATISGGSANLTGGAYVKVPYAERIAAVSGDFTWTGRFRYTTRTDRQALLWAYNWGAGQPQVWLRVQGAQIEAHAENSAVSVDVTVDRTLGDQQWHSFAVERAGPRFTLFVDGVPKSAQGMTGSFSAEPANADVFAIQLGRRLDGAYPYTGRLDDYRYYNRALTTTEVTTLTAGGTVTNGLVLQLPFDAAT